MLLCVHAKSHACVQLHFYLTDGPGRTEKLQTSGCFTGYFLAAAYHTASLYPVEYRRAGEEIPLVVFRADVMTAKMQSKYCI